MTTEWSFQGFLGLFPDNSIEAVGAQVVYLPPYSPDLNRIEKCWAWLKSRIRKQLRDATPLREAMEAVLKQAVS